MWKRVRRVPDQNGRGRYAILDMHDYEKAQATIRLMNEIAKGRRSGETEGWLSMGGRRRITRNCE